jgi:hypothetical protein
MTFGGGCGGRGERDWEERVREGGRRRAAPEVLFSQMPYGQFHYASIAWRSKQSEQLHCLLSHFVAVVGLDALQQGVHSNRIAWRLLVVV